MIEPLLIDDLRAEYTRLQGCKDSRRAVLRHFPTRLAGLTFFDPARSYGDFLIIAYQELRLLEIEVLEVLDPGGQDGGRQLEGWAPDLSQPDNAPTPPMPVVLSWFPHKIAPTNSEILTGLPPVGFLSTDDGVLQISL